MKDLFNPGNYGAKLNWVFLLLRLVVGVLMLTHGAGKFSALFGSEPIQFPDPIGLGATTTLALAVFSEVFCSILLILGLGTRLATIPLLITMLVAAFIVHANDPLSKQELPLLYSILYIVITTAGPGNISIDRWIYSRINTK